MKQRFTKDGKEINITRGRHSVTVDGEAAPRCTAKVKTYGNIWTRELSMNKGESKAGHKHEFDHLHFLAKGSVTIRVYDADDAEKIILEKQYDAPSWIKVPKEHFHDIVALKNNTLGYCIQAVRNEEGEVAATDYDKDWMEEVAEYEKANGLRDETKKE
jgi:hypothetical protein